MLGSLGGWPDQAPGMVPLGGQLGQNAVGGAVQPSRAAWVSGGRVDAAGRDSVPQLRRRPRDMIERQIPPEKLTPEVLAMIQAALGGGAAGMPPRGGGRWPAFQTLPGGRAAVPQRGGGARRVCPAPWRGGGAAGRWGRDDARRSAICRPCPAARDAQPQLLDEPGARPCSGRVHGGREPRAPATVGASCPEPQH